MATNVERKLDAYHRTTQRQRAWIEDTTRRARENEARAWEQLQTLCSTECDCPAGHCDLEGERDQV